MKNCEECKKELKPDSSYYADDGDKTFWYSDEYGSKLVCEDCYINLTTSDYSSMDKALGIG